MDATERRKRASSEAADWFARLQAGQIERAERQQFVEWLRESHIHVTEMLRIAQIHRYLKQFEHWARISTGPKTPADNIVPLTTPSDANLLQVAGEGNNLRGGNSDARQKPRVVAFAVAAAAVLVVATAFVLPRLRGQIIETERGERREVVLSDGSILQVDPQTRLRVKYVDTARQVFLEHGRALFHVAKNAHRPFLVLADGTTVRAVGTAFGVEHAEQGSVIVTVSEGKVAVESASVERAEGEGLRTENSDRTDGQGPRTESGTEKSQHSSSFSSLSPQSSALNSHPQPSALRLSARGATAVLVSADQQVTVASNGTAEPVREVDSQRALAWAEGRLIFQNDELGKAVAEFNRYNRVQLTVSDPTLAAKPVSGVFNAADPEAFIAFLQSVTAVEINRDGDASISIGAARHP